MSVFKFFAQTSPGLEKVLVEELKSFGLRVKARDDISHVQFQASYENIFRILHESRTIESLKIQVGPQIRARSEEELSKNVQKLPWAAFLPIDNLHMYNQPLVHSKSYRSNLFHEKLVSTIVEKQINLLMVRKEYKLLNNLTNGVAVKNQSFNKEIKDKKKLIDMKKDQIIQKRELQKKGESLDNESDSLIKRPQLPDIHVYLVKDKANVLMKVHLESLHKHQLKEKVGWAPIKEGIVAGSLIKMDFKSKFSKDLKIWDPFCGSGSIVLELISMMFQQKIRNQFDFFFLKNFPQQQYTEYLQKNTYESDDRGNRRKREIKSNHDPTQGEQTSEQQVQEEEREQPLKENSFLGVDSSRISVIASDISNQAIQYSLDNFHYSGLELSVNEFLKSRTRGVEEEASSLEINQDENEGEVMDCVKEEKKQKVFKVERINELAPFYIKQSFCEDKIRFIQSDFEPLSKFINLRGFTIITNLPYGLRSSEHISSSELVSAFKRFAKVIRKNMNKLEDVYIYTTVHQKYHKDHFIHISGMAWKIKQKYSLGGLQIGLFELDKDISATTTRYQVVDEEMIEENDTRLAIIEKRLILDGNTDEITKQLQALVGNRTELGLQTKKEENESNRQLEMKENLQYLRKAAVIEPGILQALDKKAHTPRQMKSIAIRRKVEYAKALRLRALMQKSKFVESLNSKEIERRIQSKRNRNNTEFIKSVMDSVGVEDKEDALSQIQEKLHKIAEVKIEKKAAYQKSQVNKNKIPRWF